MVLPKAAERLGIVYTPVEVVDFIINSVSDLLQKEFGRNISDKNVHVIDPFTGAGTFVTRLLQTGKIRKNDLKRKYEEELHANEIIPLAYYIALTNIEAAYCDLICDEKEKYSNFGGLHLTDTFRLNYAFRKECERERISQIETPITIIIGNPPYSVGQKSANDNAQNQRYENLEKRIAETYAKNSKATNKNSLYDAYIKAFRWASDRLDKTAGGIIGFVTNGAWIDSSAADGFRHCLEEEFSSIYVFNLRGNARTSGERRIKEKDNVFGSGSRTPISITILVKNPAKNSGKATIYYRDIGDYLSRGEKLRIISDSRSIIDPDLKMEKLNPNRHNDWLNQRNEIFGEFIAIGDKKDKNNKSVFFEPCYSSGLKTQRDAWCYNFSQKKLEGNIATAIDNYNDQVDKLKTGEDVIYDSNKFSWTMNTLKEVKRFKKHNYEEGCVICSMYRPYCRQNLYFSSFLNEARYQLPQLFPTPEHKNLVICVNGIGTNKDFSILMTEFVPTLGMINNVQCFPLYWYEKKSEKYLQEDELFSLKKADDGDEYIRHDGVTDFIHNLAKSKYGHKVTKEDIFYYVHGILHSEDYRARFAADLKKMLPRIPLVEKVDDFWAFSRAGMQLAELHLNYENRTPPPSVKTIGEEIGIFTIKKMKFKSKGDKSEIIYNEYIKITGIPEIAYEYVVNGRSAIEWIMDRYQVKIDKASQIKNDPNDWAEEHDNPRYILDLLLSVITVSIESVKIIKALPKFEIA